MADKKRQHYVPQFLLRNFSHDGQSIQMFVLKSGHSVKNASIKGQCYEDYYYGRDASIEEGFAIMEAKTTKLFEKLRENTPYKLTPTEKYSILLFVNYLRHRTPHAAEEACETADGLAKAMLKEFAASKKISLDKYVIEPKNPQFHNILSAVKTAPILGDLKIKLLNVENANELILSDHPVVFYNTFTENHPLFRDYPASTGMASIGLMIFLPLSPKACLMLYDPDTYSINACDRKNVLMTSDDVVQLNKLQILNSSKCIYYADQTKIGLNLEEEMATFQKMRGEMNWKISEEELCVGENTTKSSVITMRGKDTRIGAKFSFIGVIDQNSYEGYDKFTLPIRSAQLDEFTRKYSEEIEKKIKEKHYSSQNSNPKPC